MLRNINKERAVKKFGMVWKGLILALFIWVIVSAWSFQPPMSGVQSPEIYRIFYFHVPVALVTFVAYLLAMYHGLRYLASNSIDHDTRSATAAALGTVFCTLATISGSIFAKFAWGAFWNWDPRETSIAALLLVYLAYFSLRAAVPDQTKKARLAAVYSILGFIAAVFTIFVWPRLVPGLHPGAPGDSSGKVITMSNQAASVFLPSLLAFLGLFFWMYALGVRTNSLIIAHMQKE